MGTNCSMCQVEGKIIPSIGSLKHTCGYMPVCYNHIPRHLLCRKFFRPTRAVFHCVECDLVFDSIDEVIESGGLNLSGVLTCSEGHYIREKEV